MFATWRCPHPKAPPLAPRCALESGEFLIKTPLLGISCIPRVWHSGQKFPAAVLGSLHSTWTPTLYSLQ